MMSRVAVVAQQGLTEDIVAQLGDWPNSKAFTEREKLALEFTEYFCQAPQGATDEYFNRLRKGFSDKEVVELSYAVIALHGAHRLNVMIDLEPAKAEGLNYTDLPGALPVHAVR